MSDDTPEQLALFDVHEVNVMEWGTKEPVRTDYVYLNYNDSPYTHYRRRYVLGVGGDCGLTGRRDPDDMGTGE